MAVAEEITLEENEEIKDENKQGFGGMADIINKILDKPISSQKSTILGKSKKSKKRKQELKEELLEKKQRREERINFRELNHVIPTRSNAQKEVLLKKISTKGVVKLFNAVSSHQKTLSHKLKDATTESKKEKAAVTSSKNTFMDLLKKPSEDKKKVEGEEKKEGSGGWDVLRDDFMMGASMKDWDKQDEDEESEEEEEEGDSDDGEEEDD